jgi:GDPmannose 4,6-dehydratase
MNTALVVGCTGQDGSYLAELLLSKGYYVHGTKRRSSSFNTSRIDHLVSNPYFRLHYCDVTDYSSVLNAVRESQPDEIYNLAAQSHVGFSFEMPGYTAQATGLGTVNVLDAFRQYAPKARFYQASSSEMFGNQPAPQSETTPMVPVSPYGAAKLFAHNMCLTYREAYGLHISCGILFNHESPRRGETFVTRKITMGLARIKAGLQDKLVLGNLNARRDWGYAPEYVEAMWLMLQQDRPDDYVIGTGLTLSVNQWLAHCLARAGLDRSVIATDDRYNRPVELNELKACAARAAEQLDWHPEMSAWDVSRIMMEAEIASICPPVPSSLPSQPNARP